jgi:hypothetical protein
VSLCLLAYYVEHHLRIALAQWIDRSTCISTPFSVRNARSTSARLFKGRLSAGRLVRSHDINAVKVRLGRDLVLATAGKRSDRRRPSFSRTAATWPSGKERMISKP